jgi:hypothetical protein
MEHVSNLQITKAFPCMFFFKIYLYLFAFQSYYSGNVYVYDMFRNSQNLVYEGQISFVSSDFHQTYESSNWLEKRIPVSSTVHFR